MDYINPKHLFFVVCGLGIVSLKTNIVLLYRVTGRDTWIAVIVASIFIVFYMLFITHVMKKKNNYNLIDIYIKTLGKLPASILLLIIMINLIMQLIECAAVEASAMHTNLFLETPPWYLVLFFVIPGIYTVRKGLAPMISVTIIGMIFATIAGINLVTLTAKYKDYNNLLPILAENDIKSFTFGVLKSLGMYGSLICVFPILKYVADKNKINRYMLTGLFMVIQMMIVSAIGAIATYGIERSKELIYPKLIQTQEVDYFGFLESGELYVMFQIIGGWFVKYIITFFIVRELLRSFKLDREIVVYIISIGIIIPSYLISKNNITYPIFLDIYYYISLVNFIIIPTFIFFIYNLRNN